MKAITKKRSDFLFVHGLPIVYMIFVVVGALVAYKMDLFLHGYRLFLYGSFPLAVYYFAVKLGGNGS